MIFKTNIFITLINLVLFIIFQSNYDADGHLC